MSSETGIEQQDDEFHPEDTLGWKLAWVAVAILTGTLVYFF